MTETIKLPEGLNATEQVTLQQKLETFRVASEESKERFRKMREEIKQKSEAFFQDSVKLVFEQYPALESFAWTQYTPYFNDGDTCYFRANTEYLTINGSDEDDGYEGRYGLEAALKKIDPAKKAAKQAILDDLNQKKKLAVAAENFSAAENLKHQIERAEHDLQSVDENPDKLKQLLAANTILQQIFKTFEKDTLEALFGDHCKVTVSREGVNVESYEHD